MNSQFQGMSFANGHSVGNGVNGINGVNGVNGVTGVNTVGGSAPQPLSRTASSLADSIGIQRAASPFVAQPQFQGQALGSIQQAPEAFGPSPAQGPQQGSVQGPGLINDWSRRANDSTVGSPYPSQVGMGNLYSAVSPHLQNLAMPPGVVQPQLPVLVESQWKYVDTQGQIQGPFGSSSMSQWYTSGYFQPSLQIYRQGSTAEPFGINDRFLLLAELISRVNDFRDPFMAFDRIISAHVNAASAPAPNIGGPSAYNEATDHGSGVARVESDDFTHDEILQLKDKDGSYYHEVLVQIPFSRKNEQKLDPNIEVDTSMPAKNEAIKEITKRANFEGFDGPKPEHRIMASAAETTQNPAEIPKIEQEQKSSFGRLEDKMEGAKLKRQQRAEEMAKKLVAEQERQEEELKRKEELRKLKKQQKQKLKEATEAVSKSKGKASEPAAKFDSSSHEPEKDGQEPPKDIKSPLAPWANRVKNVETPRISIIELQRKEELEQAKRNQERELQERAVALKLQEQILREAKADKELKSKLTWATKNAPAPVSIDIKPQMSKRSDQESLKKKSAILSTNLSDSVSELDDPRFIQEQKKLWDEAQRSKSKPSNAAATSNAAAASSKAWTTVTSKASNSINPTKSISQPKSYISPDKLRAVSGTTSKQIGSSTSIPGLKAKYNAPVSYPGNSSIAVRQEFLKWCRSQMKLGPNVSVTSVLEVLLSLPAGPEAKEIIADTIYSNSSTMDGRRFALEFIKKRIDCEKQIKDPLTWSEALALPEGSDDDWEFQVVSKKKGRKH